MDGSPGGGTSTDSCPIDSTPTDSTLIEEHALIGVQRMIDVQRDRKGFTAGPGRFDVQIKRFTHNRVRLARRLFPLHQSPSTHHFVMMAPATPEHMNTFSTLRT